MTIKPVTQFLELICIYLYHQSEDFLSSSKWPYINPSNLCWLLNREQILNIEHVIKYLQTRVPLDIWCHCWSTPNYTTLKMLMSDQEQWYKHFLTFSKATISPQSSEALKEPCKYRGRTMSTLMNSKNTKY